ncbi:small ubiquitin-related modifier 3 [Strongylocentrotus purpuratus]|uniref:Small ubiquitin-related modifier n=1 Tax=Strongylocentrotus purpuratus TaxID=7668 RepID=A0A7M7NLX9_STRPU|nr:small ubiquitin-related modifier 3 [Strongylocentrotus purpuratus]
MTTEHKEVKPSNEHVQLKVTGDDGSTISFKIRRRTKLAKLMDAYREKQGLRGQLRFRYDGQPVNEDDTPESLEMEDEDQLEAYQEQTGGRG